MTTYSLTENHCRSTSDVRCMEHVVVDILPSWNHKTVLLVDDQIDVLITIKSMLQTCGYSVDAFNDPLLAVEHFSRHSHDYGIIISDMTMPFMSGFDFIKQVRAVSPETVTFVITASDSIKDIILNLSSLFLFLMILSIRNSYNIQKRHIDYKTNIILWEVNSTKLR